MTTQAQAVEKIEKIKYSFTYHKDGPKDVNGNYPFTYKGSGDPYKTEILDKINEVIDVVNKLQNEYLRSTLPGSRLWSVKTTRGTKDKTHHGLFP
mgnify:CR=1 FL=1